MSDSKLYLVSSIALLLSSAIKVFVKDFVFAIIFLVLAMVLLVVSRKKKKDE